MTYCAVSFSCKILYFSCCHKNALVVINSSEYEEEKNMVEQMCG